MQSSCRGTDWCKNWQDSKWHKNAEVSHFRCAQVPYFLRLFPWLWAINISLKIFKVKKKISTTQTIQNIPVAPTSLECMNILLLTGFSWSGCYSIFIGNKSEHCFPCNHWNSQNPCLKAAMSPWKLKCYASKKKKKKKWVHSLEVKMSCQWKQACWNISEATRRIKPLCVTFQYNTIH